MKFIITFKRGLEEVSRVAGRHELATDDVTVAELQKVIDVEQFLEKLLGLRVHISQM